MRRFLPERVTFWSFFSGLALALAFPRVDLASLAWVALIPLFLVMPARPFRSGFTAGVGFFGLVLYWLNIVMTTYGKLNPVFSVTAYLLLVCYLSLFFGTATWAACRFREKLGISPILTLPVVWVALEFLRSFLLTGFPWATLGYSQSNHLMLIQSADIFGVYGVSFLLILTNAVLAEVVGAARSGELRKMPWRGVTVALLLFCLNLGYGFWRLGQNLDGREDTLETALVQGNIDQSVKWDPAFQKGTINRYRDLSLAAERRDGVKLVVWPESATPFYFQDGGPLAAEVTSVPRRSDAFLLFGSPAYQYENRSYRYLNSAFLLSP